MRWYLPAGYRTTVQDYHNLWDIFVYPRLAMRSTDLVRILKPLEAMAQAPGGGL